MTRFSNYVHILFPVLFFTTLLLISGCSAKTWQVINPYQNIDWQNIERHKTNLHTHTSVGEADQNPEVVIDMYHDLGYSVIALTDHDTNGPKETTWPWTAYGRNPDSLNMVAIQGNEISKTHHIGSHFNDYGNPDTRSEDTVLTGISSRGGLALFHHPGRYKKGVEWYADKYRSYDHLIGQEVFNKKNRYPQDRANWDSVLTVLMPDRPVWGIASDDMHVPDSDMGYSWVVLLLAELNEETVREALSNGYSFFTHAPLGGSNSTQPEIKSIAVDDSNQVITLATAGNDSILWLSNGQIVERGTRIALSDLPEDAKYVRAEVFLSGNVLCTQPFGLRKD